MNAGDVAKWNFPAIELFFFKNGKKNSLYLYGREGV